MSDSIIQKSTITKINEPDFSKEITIDELFFDPLEVIQYIQGVTATMGDKLDHKKVWDSVIKLIFQKNITTQGVKILFSCYKFDIAPEDVERLSKIIKMDIGMEKAPDEFIKNHAFAAIQKKLLYDQIAKEWNAIVDETEINEMLERYYRETNQPVRDIKNDKEKLESFTSMLQERKIDMLIFNKVKYKLVPGTIEKLQKAVLDAISPKK